jgi:hypothetical protein
MRTTSASAQSPVCSLIASKLRERIYAPHELVQRRDTLVQAGCLLVGDDRRRSGRASPLAGPEGSGTPTRTSRATSATVRARTARRSAAARGRRIQQFARHQRPCGLLDHHAVLQGDLQLAGQATLGVGGHRVAEQVGHHPGAGLQGADLALIPGALASHVGVEGAESISWAPSRVTSRTGTGARCQNASMQGPCASSSWACSICSACWSEAAAQRSARTAHRAKVMGFIFSGSSLILPSGTFRRCSVSSSRDTLDGVSGRCYCARVGGSPPCANREILIRPS